MTIRKYTTTWVTICVCITDFKNLFHRGQVNHAKVTPEKVHANGNDLPSVREHKNPYTSGSFLDRLKAKQRNGAASIQLHILENYPEFHNTNIVGFDMVNQKDGNTHWLHRPSYWYEIVDTAHDDMEDGEESQRMIERMIYLKNMVSVDFRDPGGQDKVEEREVTLASKSKLKLQRRILLLPVSNRVQHHELQDYMLKAFTPLLDSFSFRNIYKDLFVENARSQKDVVNTQLGEKGDTGSSDDGKYWTLFKGALSNHCELVKHKSLDKFLTSQGLATAVTMICTKGVSKNDILNKDIPSALKPFVYSS